jgi:hypothetical protein
MKSSTQDQPPQFTLPEFTNRPLRRRREPKFSPVVGGSATCEHGVGGFTSALLGKIITGTYCDLPEPTGTYRKIPRNTGK